MKKLSALLLALAIVTIGMVYGLLLGTLIVSISFLFKTMKS